MNELAVLLISIKHIYFKTKNLFIFELKNLVRLYDDTFFKVFELKENITDESDFYKFIFYITGKNAFHEFEYSTQNLKYIYIKQDDFGNILGFSTPTDSTFYLTSSYPKFFFPNSPQKFEDISFETQNMLYNHMYNIGLITLTSVKLNILKHFVIYNSEKLDLKVTERDQFMDFLSNIFSKGEYTDCYLWSSEIKFKDNHYLTKTKPFLSIPRYYLNGIFTIKYINSNTLKLGFIFPFKI